MNVTIFDFLPDPLFDDLQTLKINDKKEFKIGETIFTVKCKDLNGQTAYEYESNEDHGLAVDINKMHQILFDKIEIQIEKEKSQEIHPS